MSKNEIKNKLLKLLQETKEGVIIPVYVKPNSDRDALILEGDELVFYTTEIPEKGRANAALIKYLSRKTGLSIAKIDIVYGVRDKTKRILVKDVDIDSLAEKILNTISSQ